MKITVLGAGAIGSLWAVALQRHHDVQVWMRTTPPDYALHYQALNGKTQSLRFPANRLEHLAHCELLLVTVKSFQVEAALQSVIQQLPETCVIVIMHNGIGSQDVVKRLFPRHPILYATTSQAALKTDNVLRHTGNGHTFIGAMQTQTTHDFSTIADRFEQALSPCKWHTDIMQPLWQKLAINCAINPLTAIYQCMNGELAQAQYQNLLKQICDEVAQVMTAEGYQTTAPKLYDQVLTVIHATANNYSSMNRDVFYQRQTEIDYITGYLIRRAKQYDIAVPANQQLWQRIKSMESSYHA